MSEVSPVSVSSAEFVRRFGSWQDRAATDPVVVTHHGRPRLVLLSAHRYRELTDAGTNAANGSAEESGCLSILVDQLDAGFVAFDRQLRIRTMNMQAATYFHVRRDGAIGREAADDMPDLARSAARTHMLRTLASGEATISDAPSLSYPGQWLRLQTFPFGEGVALLFRNVTAERAVRGLEEVRASLDAALALHARIGTGTLSQRATFTSADAGMVRMAGRSASGLDHVRLVDVLPPARRAEAAAEIEAVLAGGGARAFDTALLEGDAERPVRIALAALQGDYTIDGATVVLTPAG